MAISPVSISSNAMAAMNKANAAQKAAAASLASPAGTTSTTQTPAQTFDQVLTSLNQSEADSNNLVQQLSSGGSVDLHQVMMGVEENDINFRVTMAMRDKLVDAYREVMRMQI